MNRTARLTKREAEIAELFAWGATKKEVASRLYISARTVENHARNIYEKTGCTKVNELSAWWFCTTFHISFDLSPLRRRVIAICFLGLLMNQMVMDGGNNNPYMARTRTARTCRTESRRNTDEGDSADLFGISA